MKIKRIISCILFCSFFLCGCVRVIQPAVNKTEITTDETTQQTESPTAEITQQTETTTVGITKESEIVTEEESATEQTTVTQTSYSVIKAKMNVETNNIIRELEYPQLEGEGDKYKEINDFIKTKVFEWNSPVIEIKEDDDRQRYYASDYEIIYQTEDIISIGFHCCLYAEHGAYPIDSYNGLTFDLNTLSTIALDTYFDNVESILTLIDTDNYAVAFGGFHLFTKEETKEAMLTILENDKMNTYIDNFCIDNEYVYIIDNEIPNVLGDYSVIKFPISALK